MHWIILITLTPMLYSLVFAASLTEEVLRNTSKVKDVQDKNSTLMKEENNNAYNVSTIAAHSNDPSEEIITEASAENKNSSETFLTEEGESNSSGSNFSTLYSSESNISTIPALVNEDALQTTVREVQSADKDAPAKREDSEATAQTLPDSTSQQHNYTSEQLLPLPQTSIDQQPTPLEMPLVSVETSAEATTKTPTTTKIPSTKKPKPTKPKPPRASTVKPLAAESPVTPAVTVSPTSASVKPTKPTSTQRYPCRCGDGTCSCCTGIVLENFNVPLRSRACANVTYEPDDFAFNFKLAYNNIVLYNRRMSAKNPRPACIPINRYFGIKMCARLSNVYMSGRNMHACLDFEGFFDDETAFKYSFNCFRIGSQGVAIVRPEDGGGLPPPPEAEEEVDEDYDDSARSWRRRVRNIKGKGKWKGEVQLIPY